MVCRAHQGLLSGTILASTRPNETKSRSYTLTTLVQETPKPLRCRIVCPGQGRPAECKVVPKVVPQTAFNGSNEQSGLQVASRKICTIPQSTASDAMGRTPVQRRAKRAQAAEAE
eukprot:4481557-Prymnesium_polylepis.1